MLKWIIRLVLVIVGGTLGAALLPELFALINIDHYILTSSYFSALLGASLFYLLTFWTEPLIIKQLKNFEEKLTAIPVASIICGALGLVIGLLISLLVTIPFKFLEIYLLEEVLPFVLSLTLGYLGLAFGYKKANEIMSLFKKQVPETAPNEQQVNQEHSNKKILDTSTIIDGRIADVCRTGFVEGTLVIPQFVLAELQYIADSADTLKRARGRRGLDTLNRLQKEMPFSVEIYEGDFPDIQEVDMKLLRLTKEMDGVLITNDFNLNKIGEFQKIKVLNINDLSNAVKSIVIAGEEMHVTVIKDGKEQNQGIAYLDDGTMIVVDDGKNYIGQNIKVVVTSVLQTSAGKMIFAKPKSL